MLSENTAVVFFGQESMKVMWKTDFGGERLETEAMTDSWVGDDEDRPRLQERRGVGTDKADRMLQDIESKK